MDKEEVKLVSLEELMKDSTPYNDGSYRRGFHHGLVTAIDMLNAGKSLKEITSYTDKDVSKWRFNSDLSEKILPPGDEWL